MKNKKGQTATYILAGLILLAAAMLVQSYAVYGAEGLWVRPLCTDLTYCFVVENNSWLAEEYYIYLDDDTFRINETVLNATIDDRAVAGSSDGGTHTDQAVNTTSEVNFTSVTALNFSGNISCEDIFGSPDSDFCTDTSGASTWTYTDYFDQDLNVSDNPVFLRVNASDWLNVSIVESQVSDLVHTTDTHASNESILITESQVSDLSGHGNLTQADIEGFELDLDNNLTVTSNITVGQTVKALNFSGGLDCSDLFGGSDTDFCADATGASATWTYTDYFDQDLNSTDNVTFLDIYSTNWLNITLYVSQILDWNTTDTDTHASNASILITESQISDLSQHNNITAGTDLDSDGLTVSLETTIDSVVAINGDLTYTGNWTWQGNQTSRQDDRTCWGSICTYYNGSHLVTE